MSSEGQVRKGEGLPFVAVVLGVILCLAANCAHAMPFRLAAFGDSLMAGYNLQQGEGFVPQLQAKLAELGLEVEVLDLAISGNTTADGLNRVSEIVAAEPNGVLLALGANDSLRFIDPAEMRRNLERIITALSSDRIPLLLVGMQSSLNWGPQYKQRYDQVFPELAAQYQLALYPFLLEGVALDPDLNLPDGLHPNPAGVARIVEQMAPVVAEFIEAHSD